MHIADWNKEFFSKIDPKNYAEMMALSGVDTAIIYAGSCLGICNWPTKHGYMHKQLKGRDILKEMIFECRKKQLNVVTYFNIWSRWAYDTHPDWRIVCPNGKGTVENGWRYGLCCPNTGYREYVMSMIDELCTNYDSDGLWVDMITWTGQICYCHSCKKRFYGETGKDIPREVNWEAKTWTLFQRKREEWMADFAEEVTATAKNAKPGISVALQSATVRSGWNGGVNLDFTRQSDYLAGDFTGGRVEQSFVCKLFNSLSQEHPIEFMTPRCEDLGYHTLSRSYDRLLTQAYASIANNACFVLIDAIDPAGTLNPAFYRQARRLFDEVKKYEKYLSADAEMIADVAIYYSLESMIDFSFNKKDISEVPYANIAVAGIQNIVETFSTNHIPFTFITSKNLSDLSVYRTIVLPDVMMMDEREVAAFRRYVENGGNIYASMRTSLYHKDGEQEKDFQLADLFGVSYSGKDTAKLTYMSPEENSPFPTVCSKQYPLTIKSEQLIVIPEADTEILATLALPYTDPKNNNLFASAISNPPGIYTKHPSLTRKKYGKGHVIYSAGDIESLPYDMHREVFVNIIKDLLHEKMVFKTDAPKSVEITVFKHEEKKRIVINLLNYQAYLPPVTAHNITVTIFVKGINPTSLLTAPEGVELKYTRSGKGAIEFKVDIIEMFRMFVLHYE
jgi:beta-galactosidase GanA